VTRYRISELARLFEISRSTLLYYDRIGLLPAAGRAINGYRTYGEADRRRLARIRAFRQAGLGVEDIRALLRPGRTRSAHLLERRLAAIGTEIVALRQQQRLLSAMLRRLVTRRAPRAIDKATWVEMLRAAGLDERGMWRWHAEFEARAPEAHHDFLRELGIGESETRAIRDTARRR